MYITDYAKMKVLSLMRDTDECIEYPILNVEKYGIIYGNTKEGKKLHMLAHRVSYQLFYNDEINREDIICHKCDNPRCINPKHLFKGTHQDNCNDKVNKGRQAKGEKNGRYIDGRASDKRVHKKRKYGVLTSQQVLEVRKMIEQKIKLKDIATIMNIPYHTIKDISCNRVYKNIR